MRARLRLLWNNKVGAIAAEFALVVPIMLIFIFGIIDVGRAMFTFNRADKATQAGVRFAVATDVLPNGLAALDFMGASGLAQGQVIPESAFGKVSCDRTTCSCVTAPCHGLTAMNSAAFDAMVTRMQGMMPQITAANVRIEYSSSGLGYAGDPAGIDISPLVTVRLVNMTFEPVTFLAFGGSINVPGYPSTLSLEDGAGRLSS